MTGCVALCVQVYRKQQDKKQGSYKKNICFLCLNVKAGCSTMLYSSQIDDFGGYFLSSVCQRRVGGREDGKYKAYSAVSSSSERSALMDRAADPAGQPCAGR